ncbi:MFS transporter [Candidatus Bathyarchaeota archaeon]|nr:MFS transporter [Candidatus Bathyarchaeota archaeon]MBS7630148.1 MFS transporter [Candidatus Bathyarchaeota archaeon]
MKHYSDGYLTTVAFLVSTHFMIHIFTDVAPAILPTLRSDLGLTLVQSSLLISIPLLIQVFLYIPVGILSDKWRTAALTLSFIVTALAAFIIPYSSTFALIVVGFSLLHFGSTMYHPPSLKTASDVPKHLLNKVMALHLAGGSLGIATGPIILGALMPGIGWRPVFAFIAIPILITGLVTLFYMRGKRAGDSEAISRKNSNFRALLSKPFIMVLSIGVLTEASFVNLGAFVTTFFVNVAEISQSLASMIFGVGPLIGIIGALGGGLIGDRFGTRRTIITILIAISILLTMPLLAQMATLIVLSYVLYRTLVSAILSLMNVVITNNSPSESRSLAFSIYFLIVNLAGAIFPSITSIIIEASSIIIIFPISIFMVSTAIILLIIEKNIQS